MTQITSQDLYTKPHATLPQSVFGFHTNINNTLTVVNVGPIREYVVVEHPSKTRSELFLKRKDGSLGRNTRTYYSLSLYDSLPEAESQRVQAKENLSKLLQDKIDSLLLIQQGLSV